MSEDSPTSGDSVDDTAPLQPPWTEVTLDDVYQVDFEGPVRHSDSADAAELGDIYRKVVEETRPSAETAAFRVYSMLAAIMGMHFKPNEPNQPFGAMVVFADGRRSAIPADFRDAVGVLAEMAERSEHPVLRARLADICWLLDRKRGRLGVAAATAYVEIVSRVDAGPLRFRFDTDQTGALRHQARDLLKRALFIGRGTGMDKNGPSEAQKLVSDLRKRSVEKQQPRPAQMFGHLDLYFRISDAAQVGKDVETLITRLPVETDLHALVDLWRLAARAYHLAKLDNDKNRSQSAAAELLVTIAQRQPSAMLAAHTLTEAVGELHGVPGTKDRRKELRHLLVDVQAGIVDEMSSFSHPINLEEIAKSVEARMQRLNLLDKLFVFAALSQSPDPAELVADAERSISEHPLSSLFGVSHHDHDGKVIYRSEGAGLGDSAGDSAVRHQIARDEGIRRHITASAEIDVARRSIVEGHYLSEEIFVFLLEKSPFVPRGLVMTYSHGFTRFFQGDFISALYVLTPLLEASLRHVLKGHGHDVTKMDDATKSQEDRTISSLFEQMREELDSIFGRAITTDIENVFLKKPGPYIRHRSRMDCCATANRIRTTRSMHAGSSSSFACCRCISIGQASSCQSTKTPHGRRVESSTRRAD
ncbi:hypothetical protein [Bradyrhizobium sp. LTSPM299]|uniref:DUF7380 domain-containing protein n=1 Tax=Bradyrhizobium sp. LTSPM299 TaxID=1619233 RepID=UPI000B2027A4|nr:hypothetical protein [Bradyrhizobium sp. LTSPM299]